jgi:hypothetical protein
MAFARRIWTVPRDPADDARTPRRSTRAMVRIRPRLAWIALLAAAAVGAQEPAMPAAPDWLAGHWCGEQSGNRIEEFWVARGDQLLGLGTTTHGDALVAFEYARIEPRAGGVVYVAQPGGEAPVDFALVEWGPQRMVFTNPEHDFPQRVSYWRDDAGLHARIDGPGEEGEQHVDFDYVACPADPPAP